MCTVPQLFPEGIGKKQKEKKVYSRPERKSKQHTLEREGRKGGKKRRRDGEKKWISSASIAGLAAVPSAAQKGKTRRQTIAKIVSI